MSAFVHRILGRISGGPARPGERIRVRPDRVVLSGALAPAVLRSIHRKGRPAADLEVILTMDFQAPEVEAEVPRSRALCRELSDEFGLRHVFDLNTGIGSHVTLESTLVHPGQLAVGCGRCMGVTGAVGALGLRLGQEELAAAVVAGETEIVVPPALRVEVAGKLPRSSGPWDVAAAVRGAAGGLLEGSLVEFTGETGDWGLDLRMGVSGLLSEMGARAACFPFDDVTRKFFRERGVDPVPATPGGESEGHDHRIELSASEVVPVSAADYRGVARPLPREETGGEPIDGVFIGSCYGGRYDDLALVTEILKRSGRVHPGVRLAVSPATLETAQACLAAGFYEHFLAAGAMIVVPGGGPGSAGGGALFGDGERIASTAEYHRSLGPGQGVPDVHLVSPAAAAAAAVTGRLADPAGILA